MGPIIGTAGWSIPGEQASSFPSDGTVLERYAARFGGVEINSTFYRPHRPATWARWSASVPAGFRFAVKMPKAISHERKLVACDDLVDRFLDEIAHLGHKLSVLLLQLPPKFAYQASLVEDFLGRLRTATGAGIVCEPRHASWFEPEPDRALKRLGVARAAADPACVPAAAVPGGWSELAYWRLHGSPQIYRSPYGADRLEGYAGSIVQEMAMGRQTWCIFDNTATGAATSDAHILLHRLQKSGSPDLT
ncbi:hypothetical protein ACFB49_06180 [Sphingomonas sp. DBB INV C78]|uniref:DUF72 domain-containing protein n=1 Tax=Sphingomonas sp. DBB INV C78 TaxID=3349434 RepID=UPI0036D318CE